MTESGTPDRVAAWPGRIGSAAILCVAAALVPAPTAAAVGQAPATSAVQRMPAPRDPASRIDALVIPAVEARAFSGVVLVAHGDDVLYQRGFGFADWENHVPNTPATRFGVGSLTKSMVMVLVDALVREEGLDLETPVERYIPGFPRGPNGGVPTLNHLLQHRSGVPHRVTEPEDESWPLSAAEVVERVRATRLLFEPGAGRLYSSAGYTCLARVIEIIEGAPFERIIEERVFEPAGMTLAASETVRQLMPHRARPYHLGIAGGDLGVLNAPVKNLRFLTGAGSVYATAEDLLRFVRAIRDGRIGTDRWTTWYGTDSTSTWLGALGRTGGYEAFVDVLPARGLGLVILTNLQSGVSTEVRLKIRDILSDLEPGPVALPPPVAPEFERPDALVGTYDNDGSSIEISLVDGHLYRGENEFYPIDEGRYYVPASGAVMEFRRDASGHVVALAWGYGDTVNVAPRMR